MSVYAVRFAGARANKDGHREPEPVSLGDLVRCHERCTREYRDVVLNLKQKRKETKKSGKSKKKRGAERHRRGKGLNFCWFTDLSRLSRETPIFPRGFYLDMKVRPERKSSLR